MLKWVATILLLILFFFGIFSYFFTQNINKKMLKIPQKSSSNDQGARLSIVADNLEVPWALAFLPDGSMLFTERPGRVRVIEKNGALMQTPAAQISDVAHIGEGGLLGIVLHPDFITNNHVYLYYTYSSSGDDTLNRVVRMTYANKKLRDEQIIVDRIPGASNHNGGRIKFGSDGYLYITTGDAQNPSLAQDKNSLAGKILRVTEDGKSAPGNLFSNRVFSYGHRNPQGLAWDENGKLWSTEHGPSAHDELNRITKGANYGWPTIQGDQRKLGMETPIKNSGFSTWAPAGAAFYNGSIFFGGLRGQTLYEAVLQGDTVVEIREHFVKELGRIREVVVGPDNMLYITTSNRDGRSQPNEGDDKILRVNPEKL